MTSSPQSSSVRRQGGEAGRNITLPSAEANLDDMPTTELHQTIQPREQDTPAGYTIMEAPQSTDSHSPQPPWSARTNTIVSASQSAYADTLPDLLRQGVTGSDCSLPMFDGTSTNSHDHLIDFDTPSMERYPDVRVYFHSVGEIIGDPEGIRPIEIEARKVYDDQMVKNGREYLKLAKARGNGYFLSPSRDILANNRPGHPWYRLPTIGIIEGMMKQTIERMEDEGYLYDCDKEWELNNSYFMLTNIRVPIIWAECYRHDVVPGTTGWDSTIDRVYGGDHPAYWCWAHGWTSDQVVYHLMVLAGGTNKPGYACLRSDVERVLRRNWPNLKRPYSRSELVYDNPQFTDLPNNTMDQFLCRAPP